MQKRADAAYPLHDLIAERWSPRAFEDRPVEDAKLRSLLEAARWAPSCFNDQPWNFLVVRRHEEPEAFANLASCLMDGNAWAKDAAVLIVSVAREDFTHNGKPNAHAWHDVGLAVGNLLVQAQSMGLYAHQMAGFFADQLRERADLPEGFSPVAFLALGYPGKADQLEGELKDRELAPRSRHPQADFVHGGRYGEKPSF